MDMPYDIKSGLVAACSALSLIGVGSAYADDPVSERASLVTAPEKPAFATLEIGGRLHLDYTRARAENAALDIEGSELRRARLNIKGRLGSRFNYHVSSSIDGSGEIAVVDAYLDWKPINTNFKVRVGQFKEPMSLDETTSSRYISTLERSAFTDALDISRRVGIGLFHNGKKHTLAAGIFGANLNGEPFSGSSAIAARATYSPFAGPEQTLHLGASVRYRTDGKGEDALRYRQRPYARVSNRIISTGRIAQSDLVIAAEAAILYKNFWAAGEYTAIQANCLACLSDPGFNGYYAELGMFIGGRKVYKGGKFNRPVIDKPVNQGGLGALALVARYDSIDLNDTDVQGGDLNTLVLGADWYPTQHLRFSINYFNADAQFGNINSGVGSEFIALRNSGVLDENVEGITLRSQYTF